MKKILMSQKGVTLIETLAAAVIIILLLLTVLGALLFGQGVIVGNDDKNNAAATAQEIIDDLMASLSGSATYSGEAVNTGTGFIDPGKPGEDDYTPKQYYLVAEEVTVQIVDNTGAPVNSSTKSAYQINVRVYYNQGQSYVDLTAFNKDGGVDK